MNSHIQPLVTWTPFLSFIFPLSNPENSCLNVLWTSSKSSFTLFLLLLLQTYKYVFPIPSLLLSRHAQMFPRFCCIHFWMAPLANMTVITFIIKSISKYCIKLRSDTIVHVSMFLLVIKFLYYHTYVLTELVYIAF